MNNKLTNISTQYRKFSRGQYIEYKQFNGFLDFFEDQDRLSKVLLQGVGIACGLKPELVYKDRMLNSIRLSQGIALTTDGDLLTLNNTGKVSDELYISDLKTISLENKSFTHFKKYDTPKTEYDAFYNGDGSLIELWELATAKEATSDFQPVADLSGLEDKYLLLYLEDYEKEVKPCRGVDCDNHGIQQIRNLKVLVTTAKGIANILEEDRIHPHPLFLDNVMIAQKQERVFIQRLMSEKGTEVPVSSLEIKNLYAKVLEKNTYGEAVFKKVNAIAEMIGISGISHENFKTAVVKCLAQKVGFQYAYDVIKDLTDTCEEIIKLLPKTFTGHIPDLLSFPKHIMLGKITSGIQLDYSRHRFYNSPVLDAGNETEKVKALISRFRQQAENFRYGESFEKTATIKITPSRKSDSLSNKAIPFYYRVTEEFLKAWNFCRTSHRSSGYNLGYDSALLSLDEHIQAPVDFNIDKNSFYNIEGHQGMDYKEAFEQITKIRDEKQLAFDVMVLSLAELKNNKNLFKAYFNEYVEKHPGLEHKRGVERGGTFIIVYEMNESSSNIVADFSIPYICCTPKVEVKLTLPSTIICSKAGHIPFTVFPMDGIVEAVAEENVETGVKEIDGKYFFDPSLVDSLLYNKTISFTVNGKPTGCTIKVIPQSEVEVKVVSVTHSTGSSVLTTVKFWIEGSEIADYTYSWDFWDNNNWVNVAPDENGYVTYTFSDLNPKIIPVIKVKVSHNGCTQDIAIIDWYKDRESDLAITGIVFTEGGDCCEGIIPITVTAYAGEDKNIELNSVETFRLSGSGSISGSDSYHLIYSWDQISGPITAALSGQETMTLSVSNLIAGIYKFQLKVTDTVSGIYALDSVQVNVSG